MYVKDGEESKTAFRTPVETFVMPFGLSSAQVAVRRSVDTTFRSHQGVICQLYLDDLFFTAIAVENMNDA